MNKILCFIFIVSFKCLGQEVHFSDSAFQRAILTHQPPIDVNNDGLIQLDEAATVRELNLMRKGLSNIEDLRLFPNIKALYVTDNDIESLVLTDLDSLEKLFIANNKLAFLELQHLPSLKDIACGFNALTTVTLTDLPNLESLDLTDNQLESIETSMYPKLKYLSLGSNKIKQVDISKNQVLIQLMINKNPLKSLDISLNPVLKVESLYVDKEVTLIATPEQLKKARGKSFKVSD